MKKLIRDIIIILCSFIISILTFFSGIKLYMYVNTKNFIYELEELNKTYDYVIVPGAQIKKDGPTKVLKDRLDMAIMLYQKEISKKIIVSGAYEKSLGKYESETMKEYLIEKGIPGDVIIEDRAGVTTYDTMIRVYNFTKDQTAIISTQTMYASRSIYLAHQVGLKADVVTSDLTYKNQNLFAYIREFFAPTKAFYYGEILNPLPKCSLDNCPFIIEKPLVCGFICLPIGIN